MNVMTDMGELLAKIGLVRGDLSGRVVLITGAAGGLGQPVAEACARLGARVGVTDIVPVDGLVARMSALGAQAHGVQADLTIDGEPDRVVDRIEQALGTVDVFLHLAATARVAPMVALEAADWSRAYRLHVEAAWQFARRLIPAMTAARRGIFCAAVSAPVTPFLSAYGSTKMSVRALIENLALELGPDAGVHVFGFMPGALDSRLLHQAMADVSSVTGIPREALTDQIAQNPGYPGLVPPEHSAIGLAYELVNAWSLHGQVTDPFAHLIRTGIAPEPTMKRSKDEGLMAATGKYVGGVAEQNHHLELRIERRTRELAEERARSEALLHESNRLMDEVRELNALLQEQVIRDHLTGLYNRRYPEDTLERELIRAQRNGRPVTVVLADIDYFKVVNDTFGHLAGDEVLKAVGELLKSHSRGSDICCRYGGEEFLLVLPEAPEEVAAVRTEKLRAAIAAHPIRFESANIQVTASFGIATYPQHGASGNELIAAADAALYQAKLRGRNRVQRAGADDSTQRTG